MTEAELCDALGRLGVVPGDLLMVHASMRAVGGPADDMVRALLRALGERGTVMAYVDFEPVDDGRAFDPVRSPASGDHGVLAEVLRRWPGALRSLNPGASVAAVGARAGWLCADHPLHYGYGPGSPLAKLCGAGGKVLLLGAHFDHVTLLHHAEHLARVPHKRVCRYTVAIEGRAVEIEEFDTSQGVVPAMPDLYFDTLVRTFVELGGARQGRVGGALCQLLPARELTAFAVARMERDFGAGDGSPTSASG